MKGARGTSSPGTARVVHHVRGRVRLKISHAKGDAEFLERIKQSLSPMPGVRRVDVNPQTGSVLIEYDPAAHSDFHERLERHAAEGDIFDLKPPELSEVDELARRIEREAEFLSARSEVAKSIVDFVKQINVGVKKLSNNAVDLNVLLPLGLAVYSVLELETDVSTPMWVTLGIFSFNSFLTLHTQPPRVDVHAQEVVLNPPAEVAENASAHS